MDINETIEGNTAFQISYNQLKNSQRLSNAESKNCRIASKYKNFYFFCLRLGSVTIKKAQSGKTDKNKAKQNKFEMKKEVC